MTSQLLQLSRDWVQRLRMLYSELYTGRHYSTEHPDYCIRTYTDGHVTLRRVLQIVDTRAFRMSVDTRRTIIAGSRYNFAFSVVVDVLCLESGCPTLKHTIMSVRGRSQRVRYLAGVSPDLVPHLEDALCRWLVVPFLDIDLDHDAVGAYIRAVIDAGPVTKTPTLREWVECLPSKPVSAERRHRLLIL